MAAVPLAWMPMLTVHPPRVFAPQSDPSKCSISKKDLIVMTISPELEAQILRYYHVENWRNGAIARQLHLHWPAGGYQSWPQVAKASIAMAVSWRRVFTRARASRRTARVASGG
jgi:hypothetical protein